MNVLISVTGFKGQNAYERTWVQFNTTIVKARAAAKKIMPTREGYDNHKFFIQDFDEWKAEIDPGEFANKNLYFCRAVINVEKDGIKQNQHYAMLCSDINIENAKLAVLIP